MTEAAREQQLPIPSQEQPWLELVPPPASPEVTQESEDEQQKEKESRIMLQALFEPVQGIAIDTGELTEISRKPRNVQAAHLVTTLLLRSAGEEDSVHGFNEFDGMAETYYSLKSKDDTSAKTIAAAKKEFDQARQKAQTYAAIYELVKGYAAVYDRTYVQESTATAKPIEIYQTTEHITHPALDYITGALRQAQRDVSIEAERILRIILMGAEQMALAAADQPPQEQ